MREYEDRQGIRALASFFLGVGFSLTQMRKNASACGAAILAFPQHSLALHHFSLV
jgi:hypothetical protein